MPRNTTTPDIARTRSFNFILELAVPGLSFGGAALALVAAQTGSAIDIRYFGLGCVFASFILAYLAWIRPRRDLVSLTMPLYAVLIFVLPSDLVIDLVLILLYAISLSLVMIRLKYRFGEAGAPVADGLDGPLGQYCESVAGVLATTGPATARAAAKVYLHVARADYHLASGCAAEALLGQEAGGMNPVLRTAFTIVQEQTELLENHAERPEAYCSFNPADYDILAKPAVPDQTDAGFERALENALLLLFAAGWIASGEETRHALSVEKDFAVRLVTE